MGDRDSPPDLARLAEAGRQARQQHEAERQASRQERRDRLRQRAVRAVRARTHKRALVGACVACWAVGTVVPVATGFVVPWWTLFFWYGAAAVLFALSERYPASKRLVAEELAWAEQLPFPVHGYRDWIPARERRIVIELAAAPPASLPDVLASAVPAIETAWLAPRRLSIRLPDRELANQNDLPPDYVGDVHAFHQVADVLAALHSTYPIERIDMSSGEGA